MFLYFYKCLNKIFLLRMIEMTLRLSYQHKIFSSGVSTLKVEQNDSENCVGNFVRIS